MSTEISRSSAPIIGHSRTLEVPSAGISPLVTAVGVLFIVVHLASGVMIGRSHASPAIEPAALTAAADEVTCSSETRQRQPWLPNDWSLSSD
jgi:hypothetical protein